MRHAILALLCVACLGASACVTRPATGEFGVGRASLVWQDPARDEVVTPAPGEHRETAVVIWYPADRTPAGKAPYFPGLRKVSRAMVAGGTLSSLEAFGLGMVSTHERLGAPLSAAAQAWPVVLLSPGNGNNAELYDAIAAELASRGYIVVGLNHPYDAAGVMLSDGRAVSFVEGPLDAQRPDWVAGRVDTRVADLEFVLRRLAQLGAPGDPFPASRLDLAHVGVMGHSLGAIAAAQACYANPQFRACLNLDGIQRGGPFGTAPVTATPAQPFMFITKEQDLPPATTALLKAGGARDFLVVLPGATHDNFTDSAVLLPSFLPAHGRGQQVMDTINGYVVAFFDQTLRGRSSDLLKKARNTPGVRYEPPE